MNPVSCKISKAVIVGCGDIGLRVAGQLTSQHIPVTGIARSEASQQRNHAAGIAAMRLDLDGGPAIIAGQSGSVVFYLAPPPPGGVTDSRMTNYLAGLADGELPARLVYLSTSGVYGDQQGRTITEESATRPTADRARRRFDAEQQLRRYSDDHGLPVVILRVGGIYGPGRLPVKRLQEGIPIIHEHLAPKTNRIHADDLATICIAAAERGRPGEIYNVSDGTDSNMTQYFNLVADHLGLPRPPTIGWQEAEQVLSPGMLSYLRESRRMDNRKMREELGVELRYPDIHAGLKSCPPG